MKKTFGFLLIVILFFSCSGNNDADLDKQKNDKKKIKIGLALGYGGIGDQSFNDMQYNGLIEASRKFDIDITYAVPEEDTENGMVKLLEKLALEKCDLIITSGFLAVEPIKKIAPKYKNIHFVIIDDTVAGFKNVTTALYAQSEGSYLAGAMAAMKTKTNHIGFIGGVDIPVIYDFLDGYKLGAKKINPAINIEVEFCSKLPDFSGFSQPKKGYAIAKKMYSKKVDIIYSVAGETGNGIILAAKDNEKYVIGVDSDQDHLAKGYILTSMMKRLDVTVIDVCRKYIEGELKGNYTYMYNLKNNGVSLSPMKYTYDLLNFRERKILDRLKKEIVEGKIKTNVE